MSAAEDSRPAAPRSPWYRVALRLSFRIARIAGLVWILGTLLLFFFQEKLIYRPTREVLATPALVELPFEDLSLDVEDGQHLHAWWVPHPNPKGVLLYCHGNSGNIGHRVDSLRFFHDLRLCVLIFDYRGYGRSEGEPSEQGTYADGEAAFAVLGQKGFRPERILLYGRSLGTGIASHLATRHDVAGLILDSAFTSLPDAAEDRYPWAPVHWLARHRYPVLENVTKLRCPLLLLHATDDEVVAFHHAERLRDAAATTTTLVPLRLGHNAAMKARDLQRPLEAFLDRTLR